MSTPRQEGVRVLVLGNGVTSAERQCVGLLRALWPDAGIARAEDGQDGLWQLTRVTDWARSPAAALLRSLPAAAHVLAGSHFAGVDVAAFAAQADAALVRDGLLTLLVACGRDTVAAAAAVRAAAPRAVVAVQLLHPRVALAAFDLCVVPAHDSVASEARVHRTLGVLHDFDASNLAAARALWADALADAPRPLVLCLVGAPTRCCPFDGAALTRDVAELAADVERSGGSLRICPSRRTPPGLVSAVRWAVMGVRCARVVPLSGAGNPYPGLLAWADALVVTADSVSMASEAAATGASLYLLAADRSCGKLRRFLDALVATGAALPWSRGAALCGTQRCGPRLQEASAAAAAVRQVLDARRAALKIA